jgi:hypothetical protein
MRKLVGGILTVLVGALLGAYAFGREAKYVQSGCEISETYFAYVYMVSEADAGKPNARKYSVEFNPERLIVRFPPAYYALKWEETTVLVEYRSEKSDEALLSLRNDGFPVTARTRPIGEIRRDCWEKVKGYIQRNVRTPVHIVETVAGV